MLNTIEKVLGNMAKNGLIFDNEKDFQLNFATELQEQLNQTEEGNTVFLECWALKSDKAACRTDIVVQTPKKEYIAIELKYKMTDKDCEKREFPKQEAQDLGKYDFLLDVSRNERLLKGETILGYNFIKGYAIILTNDHLYWHVAKPVYQYEEFRIDNRVDEKDDSLPVKVLAGKKSWHGEPKSCSGRESSIELTHSYTAYWKRYNYCKEGCDSCKNIFKYLILETK